jgi:hypothetical protein
VFHDYGFSDFSPLFFLSLLAFLIISAPCTRNLAMKLRFSQCETALNNTVVAFFFCA